MTSHIPHEMIKASAGSGKTYKLVNRYLTLLARGESPDRIAALTFTRKAAGEFLQEIFLRLSETAASDKKARELSIDIGLEPKDSQFFKELLIKLIKDIGRLQLGTIDHFFAKVVGAFPFELGLSRPHQIMDDFEQKVAMRRTMSDLLEVSSPETQRFLVQLYKNLTWGTEDKRIYDFFEKKLSGYHSIYVETLETALWGNPGAIQDSPPWWHVDSPDWIQLLDSIEDMVIASEFKNQIRKAFLTLLGKMRSWQPGQSVKGGTLLDSLLVIREDLKLGQAAITYSRSTTELSPSLSQSLYTMLQVYIGDEIKRSLLVSRSLGSLLESYDERYATLIRETGSLVFSDLPMLLLRALSADADIFSGGTMLYRLDAQIDHWLLDEFQDTSRIQWSVLSNFVDEIIQDPTARRTFFYVGDVKQSIYAWRGGDARLFNEIRHHYGDVIKDSVLGKSWRSAPPVLDCVNGLFGEGLAKTQLPEAVLKRWSDDWTEHLPSPKTESLSGYGGWGLVGSDDSIDAAIVELLERLNPLDRGMSCAILVRNNNEVSELTQSLRKAGIPASMEGRMFIAKDNVVGAWVRGFIYSVIRPGERFPFGYLQMIDPGLTPQIYLKLANNFRTAHSGEGITGAVRLLMEHLNDVITGNPFLLRRSEQIVELTARFRATGEESLEAYIDFIETSTVDESTLHSQVQVMTVHKAKGLDFDMVVVAGFGEKAITALRGIDLHVQRDEQGSVDWILEMPRSEIVLADSSLSQARTEKINSEYFESLCILYVAMTRARQGLYCIAKEHTGNSKNILWQDLFADAYGMPAEERVEGLIRWQKEWGTADWISDCQKESKQPQSLRLVSLNDKLPPVRQYLRREASPSQDAHASMEDMHPLRSSKGRRFGTRMHDYLSTIDWIDFGDPSNVDRIIEDADSDLKDRLRSFLGSTYGREVFLKPDSPCLLWREKPYALRAGKILTQGIIDRAHVITDDNGAPAEVIIIDYKTDKLQPDMPAEDQLRERYGKQVERYVEAVCSLTGLEPGKVATRLIPV